MTQKAKRNRKKEKKVSFHFSLRVCIKDEKKSFNCKQQTISSVHLIFLHVIYLVIILNVIV